MNQINFNNSTQQLDAWSKNKYPINNQESFLKIFAEALEEIHQLPEFKDQSISLDNYQNTYNRVILNPIFDSHPIDFIWSDNTD